MIQWILTQGILGLSFSLGFLLNHRGSSMNLKFESILQGLNKRIPINNKVIKKTNKKSHIPYKKQKQIKEIGKERIQEACKDQDKDGRANLIFWYYRHKEELSDFLLSYLQRRLNQRLINKFQTFYYISVPTSIWVFCLSCTR